MPSFKTTIEVECEITYTTDKDIRQGDDARYPSEVCIDDLSWEFVDKNDVDMEIKLEAETHLQESQYEWIKKGYMGTTR